LLAKPSAHTGEIRLIMLDQNSLDWAKNENGLSWPWPREVYGSIIQFCKRAGVQSLAFDVLLPNLPNTVWLMISPLPPRSAVLNILWEPSFSVVLKAVKKAGLLLLPRQN